MDFRSVYGDGACRSTVMVKYAIYFVIFLLVIGGAYLAGYHIGAADRQVEYVTKEIEVIKYVDKKKSDIYSKPNATRNELLKLMHDNVL